MPDHTANAATADDDLLFQRLDELETRLSFQDHGLSELNEAMVAQNERIIVLERQLVRALDDLGKLRGLLLADPGEEPPPPHY